MGKSNENHRVCVIGLGAMGSALAQAVLAKDFKVTVWNRTSSKCDALAYAGASVSASVTEAAVSADTIVVCLTNHDACTSVLWTDEVAGALQGKTLVQVSTVTAEESRDMGRWAEDHGIAYLDGSIFGYPKDFVDSGCTIIYSGPKSIFDASEAVLFAMGGKPKHVGEAIGGALTLDKAIYAYVYGSTFGFLHGAAICRAAGLTLDEYVEQIVGFGAGSKPQLGELLIKQSYEATGATLEIEAAGYDHVVKLVDELSLDATFSTAVSNLFKRAMADGLGDQGIAAMVKVMTKSQGA
jgi:3-hydroxyisobutyrate dehydrogenase-like beta-hydroxyacid dehydrogenase